MSSAHSLPDAWPRGMRVEVATAYVGGRANLDRLVSIGLKPVVQHKSNTTYDKVLVDKAMDKALAMGWPEPTGPEGKGGRKA